MRLKLLINRCLLTCVAALATLSANAYYDFESNGIYYVITDAEAKNVYVYFNTDSNSQRINYAGDIVIPNKVSDKGIEYNVVGLYSTAFKQTPELTSLQLPEGITSITSESFKGCTGLQTIKLPSTLNFIGQGAFEGCSALTNIDLPSNLKTIRSSVFYNCSALERIIWPKNITTIPAFTFQGCESLKDITIPEGITTIEQHAFWDCISLPSIQFPSTLKVIGQAAFQNCQSLTHLYIPDNVTTIEDYAFNTCENLETVEIGAGIKSIGYYAFFRDLKLNLLTIHATEPPLANPSPFQPNGHHYNYTDLAVPYESIEKYRTAPVWENFFQDRWPLTGIEGVEAEGDNEVVGCYDLYGRSVTEDYRGVVIVRYADGTTSKEVRR